jgi:ABC-type nickel/cobalt efflux system permease component RcnA
MKVLIVFGSILTILGLLGFLELIAFHNEPRSEDIVGRIIVVAFGVFLLWFAFAIKKNEAKRAEWAARNAKAAEAAQEAAQEAAFEVELAKRKKQNAHNIGRIGHCPNCGSELERSEHYISHHHELRISWYCKFCKHSRTTFGEHDRDNR